MKLPSRCWERWAVNSASHCGKVKVEASVVADSFSAPLTCQTGLCPKLLISHWLVMETVRPHDGLRRAQAIVEEVSSQTAQVALWRQAATPYWPMLYCAEFKSQHVQVFNLFGCSTYAQFRMQMSGPKELVLSNLVCGDCRVVSPNCHARNAQGWSTRCVGRSAGRPRSCFRAVLNRRSWPGFVSC